MITNDAIAGMAISALLAILLPAVTFFALRRHHQLLGRNVLAGVAVFILAVVVLEAAMHAYVLQLNPVTKAFFDSTPLAFGVYAASAAAIFEEGGRYVAMRWFVRRVPGSGSPLAYGIGHGGAEAFLIGLNVAVLAALGYLISTGQAAALHLDAATQSKIAEMLKGATFSSSLLSGIERVSAFVIQLGFSFLVWQAVKTRRIGFWFAALAAHFAVDFPAALFQRKMLPVSAIELEGAVAMVALLVLAALWAFAPRASEEAAA